MGGGTEVTEIEGTSAGVSFAGGAGGGTSTCATGAGTSFWGETASGVREPAFAAFLDAIRASFCARFLALFVRVVGVLKYQKQKISELAQHDRIKCALTT